MAAADFNHGQQIAVSDVKQGQQKNRDMKKLSIFKNPVTTALCWGIIGGLLMTLFPKLPFVTWISEILMMITMALCLIASLLTVQLNPSDKKYLKLLSSAFLTFVIMSIVAHLTLYMTNNSTYNLKWVETGPIILWFAIGAVFCAAFTFFALRRR
jgi:hypothetical protein